MSPSSRTRACILILLGLGAWMWHPVDLAEEQMPGLGPPLTGLFLMGAFAATECLLLQVQIRGEARTVSLSDMALVVGLFFTPPGQLILARLVGSLVVSALVRRQPPLKLAFSTACMLLEVWVAVHLFRALVGPSELGLRSWGAALVAVAVTGAVTSALVTLLLTVSEGLQRLRELRVSIVTGATLGLSAGVPALLAVQALAFDPRTAVLTAGMLGLCLMAFRKYAELARRHLSLERLYDFTRVVSRSPEVDSVLLSLLQQAKELVQGRHAEIVLDMSRGQGEDVRIVIDTDANGALRRTEATSWTVLRPIEHVLSGGEPVMLSTEGTSAGRRWLHARGFTEAVLVPLPGERGAVGVLMVAEPVGDAATFDAGDLRLLATVANHASVALENGRLLTQLRHEALHDALTGLPNRLQMGRFLAHQSEVMRKHGTGFAVMVLDLDDFKQINDALGHQEGDIVLCAAGERLRHCTRPDDLVVRLGGDEFAVVMPGLVDEEQVMLVGRRVAACLQELVQLTDSQVHVRVSIGLAIAPLHGANASEVLRHADLAMYEAKASGRGLKMYDRTMMPGTPTLLAMTSELQDATERADELVVFLQPQARMSDGSIAGAEALVRWQHPRAGLLYPDAFIGLAERTGLVSALTKIVLSKSLASLACWPSLGYPAHVAVNLSAKCLQEPDLVEDIAAALAEHGVQPNQLTLEVTESSVMTDPTRAVAALEGLADLGVRLSVDDFGTGYSSLSYLKRLPIHEVKIDKGFVRDLCSNADDLAIVRSVIDLGHNLGLDIVAEGVEDAATWDLLGRLGCTLVQGYGLARPMPADHLPSWLRSYEQGRPTVSAAAEGEPVGLHVPVVLLAPELHGRQWFRDAG